MVETLSPAELIAYRRRQRRQSLTRTTLYGVALLGFILVRTHDTKQLADYAKCNEDRRDAYIVKDLKWKHALADTENEFIGGKITASIYHLRRKAAFDDVFDAVEAAKKTKC